MKSIPDVYELGVVFDILLHQAPLVSTINLMLQKVAKKFCVVQPLLEEQSLGNTLVYLPGNRSGRELLPRGTGAEDYKLLDVENVNHSHWIWGMTRSFLASLLAGEGFEIAHEERLGSFPNDKWYLWGCVAERRRENPAHWSRLGVCRDLIAGR